MEEITKVKANLKMDFEMKDLGHQEEYWDKIERDRKKKLLQLSQETYLKKVLETIRMSNLKLVVISTSQQFKLSVSQSPKKIEELTYMESIPYANIAGSIMYAMVCTRPDIAHAVSLLIVFMPNPRKAHWQALKWILRYIKGSLGRVLVYGGAKDKKGTTTIEGFVDSDYAWGLDTRKSLTGYVFVVYGITISWKKNL